MILSSVALMISLALGVTLSSDVNAKPMIPVVKSPSPVELHRVSHTHYFFCLREILTEAPSASQRHQDHPRGPEYRS